MNTRMHAWAPNHLFLFPLTIKINKLMLLARQVIYEVVNRFLFKMLGQNL